MLRCSAVQTCTLTSPRRRSSRSLSWTTRGGWPELDALSSEDVARNPANRCYYCKQNIFGNLKRAAAEDGFTLILDGTNASDDAGDRPGMRALREMDVRSPLRECGLTKAEIRRLSHEAGLFTWDKPAYACLATRIPTGTPIQARDLERVERAEAALAALGFRDFRVRLFHGAARVQATAAQLPLALERREDLTVALRSDFSDILLDLAPRAPSA